jgi:four helix bundle protein
MKAEGGNQDLRTRTKEYALRVIRLYRALPPRDGVADVVGKQLLRSATSVAAHYREACRAKSDLDFTSKLEGAQQELDESDLWLELLADFKRDQIKSNSTSAPRDKRIDRNLRNDDQKCKNAQARGDLISAFLLPPSAFIFLPGQANRRTDMAVVR